MIHVGSPRRRLAAAVTAVLAVTAAGLATPAVATTPPGAETTATATATQQAAISLPPGSRYVSHGPSGLLTILRTDKGAEYRWTRYSDGVTTLLPAREYLGSPQTDLVVTSAGSVHTFHDLAAGTTPVTIDATKLGPDAKLRRPIGTTLVMDKPNSAGGTEVHLVSKPGDTVLDRKVTGLPENASVYRYDMSTLDTLILTYNTVGGPGKHLALVDVATGAVVEDRALPVVSDEGDAGMSATQVIWTEQSATGAVTLAVARRGDTSAEPERVVLGSGTVRTELLGDWVTYGATSAPTDNRDPNLLYGLTARSLTSGKTVKLLDSMRSSVFSEADGNQIVRGGTVEHGEGFYRISVGTDGTPVATLVASTGEPTAVVAEVYKPLPDVVDFEHGDAKFWWYVKRGNAELKVELTHTASGKRWTSEPSYLDRPYVTGAIWTGQFGDYTSAYNGAYTWRMTARPTDGIGPTVEQTGTLKVANKPAPHDFSDSGAPDLLVKDDSGRLVGYDGHQTLIAQRYQRERVDYGTGWNIYDRVAAPGNIGGSVHADILGRDRSGVLWLYTGTGKGFAPRTKIGAGWQTYDKLTGGSDLTGDGRPDLVAADKAGDLYLYKGTGNAAAPFAPRKKIGWGWGIYNQLTATGNLGGAAAGDLVARDKDGVLWLYLGKGDGTFAARTRIGGGWDRYTDLVGVGDTNRDGRPDLVAQGVMGGTYETLALYKGTGIWRAPFGSRNEVYTPQQLGTGNVTLF
ncbi:VCBS repeat-containing protein [Streptomyces sp. P9(2023)]|uniref:FG-GAP repeat domain-containing protein n=1 Tax=Streptomyces sp. P9(2023) TaxID=3064394 RepID=UPI0028F43A45|nr:VCBS repeat-containing protein [Streptomyces sp. P9(2023)]MDT9690552.1 VCBS repeat-containing protein [Streptomyces sp. P9(2023)]